MPATAADAADGPAGVQVTWESYPGWVRNNVASVLSVGITTPGTTDDTYAMSDFTFAQESDGNGGTGANNCYAAIATEPVTSKGASVEPSKILAFSSNQIYATNPNSEYYTYYLESPIELKGGTTYHIIFFENKNTNDEGNYTPCTQRISLYLYNEVTYAPGLYDGNGYYRDTWVPGFRATLITESVYDVTYTCKSTKDESVITTGTFENVVNFVTPPTIDGYLFAYAETTDGTSIEDINNTYQITEDTELVFYYTPLYNIAYTCKSTADESVMSSGTFENIVYGSTIANVPALDNYIFAYAQDARGANIEDISTYEITEATALVFYYDVLQFPEAGTFFRIKGKNNTYIAAGNANNNNKTYNMSDVKDATTIFYYNENKLLNYSSGLYNGVTSGSWNWALGVENACEVTFEDGHVSGGFAVKSSNVYFYDCVSYLDRATGLMANDARPINWTIESVNALPVTISGEGWATFSAPVATVIPSEVTAYTATVSGDNLELTAIEGGVIPANTGVLLEGGVGEYSFEITDNEGAEVGKNALQYNIGAKNVASLSVYVLARGNNGLGFYLLKADEGSETAVMSGFKAYLPTIGGEPTEAKAFYGFDGDITGIDSVEASAADANTYYDLQGRRVAAPQKGQLYIVNGKKVLY